MKNSTLSPALFLLILGFVACGCDILTVEGEKSDVFENTPTRFPFASGRIDEASGLAASQTLKGYLWTHNDSGNAAELFLLSQDGKDLRSYSTPGIENRDWEDIAVGPGPADGVSYVYVADFGNNGANPDVPVYTIYRLPEPRSLNAGFEAGSVGRISYRYPDGPHDAEALLVDPQTKDIFIVSKGFEGAKLYRLPFPQAENSVITAEGMGSVPGVVLATGSDMTADGKEIIVRTYSDLYYWRRGKKETVGQTLSRKPLKTLPYELEPQGEGVGFDADMNGYYTLSELRQGLPVTLNYYKRK
jgi:hypothetical protein